MLSDAILKEWTEWARRDDWHRRFVGSDIRQMLGEIERLQQARDQWCAAYTELRDQQKPVNN